MRFTQIIRYGTERYPEKVARRLRATNIAAWIGASATGFFAIWRFLQGAEHWKYTVLVALAFGLTPFLHRFSPLAAPLALVAIGYTWSFYLGFTQGVANGPNLIFFTAGALGILVIGTERALLSIVIGAVGTGLYIVLYTPFSRSPLTLVVNVVSGSAVLCGIVFYAVRQFTRAEERLELANLAKTRFLAAASHDLRQPLHALGLFVAQLRSHMKSAEGDQLIDRIDAAVTAMNELFNALLDISKLDADAVSPKLAEFPVADLLQRIETTFRAAAEEKGLSFHLVSTSAWVRSDPILLERIVLNLVSNAVRYTVSGGLVIGCRRRADSLRIEVWDSGPGIPEDQRRNIFSEFYRLASVTKGGLGLGLAIVDRLGGLLDHPIELVSTLGRGSRFAVTMPMVAAQAKAQPTPPTPAAVVNDLFTGKRVIIIDDDVLVLDSMSGLLRDWGCRVITAASVEAALSSLGGDHRPDLIISDYRLAQGHSGIAAIAKLRTAHGAVPTFLMSGDIAPERLSEARESGYHLLHKPVQPMILRTMVSRFLRGGGAATQGLRLDSL
jgi:signal transduction histidine kinase/CheY-like chemotaxis protein